MNQASLGNIDSVDAIIHMVDASEKTGLEEKHVISRLNKCGKPIIVGLNKIDITKGKFVPEYIKLWEEIRGVPMTEMKDLVLFHYLLLKGPM